jgi:hypothetical protein
MQTENIMLKKLRSALQQKCFLYYVDSKLNSALNRRYCHLFDCDDPACQCRVFFLQMKRFNLFRENSHLSLN